MPGKARTEPAKTYASAPAIQRWVVTFANVDLEALPSEKRRGFEEDLFLLSEWTSRAPWPTFPDLYNLQQELRGILRDLAGGDPWADQPTYRRLAAKGYGKKNGLGGFEHQPIWAFTAAPLAVEFQWWRAGQKISEQIIPKDLRSGVLIRLRDAIRTAPFQVRKCPVCGKFFIRVKRQLYCEGSCAAKADTVLRSQRVRRRR